MVFQYIFKLLNYHSCQQQPHTECYKPARPAASNVNDALPPAEAKQQHDVINSATKLETPSGCGWTNDTQLPRPAVTQSVAGSLLSVLTSSLLHIPRHLISLTYVSECEAAKPSFRSLCHAAQTEHQSCLLHCLPAFAALALPQPLCN